MECIAVSYMVIRIKSQMYTDFGKSTQFFIEKWTTNLKVETTVFLLRKIVATLDLQYNYGAVF